MFYWYIVTGDPPRHITGSWYSKNGCFFRYIKKMYYLCSRNKKTDKNMEIFDNNEKEQLLTIKNK